MNKRASAAMHAQTRASRSVKPPTTGAVERQPPPTVSARWIGSALLVVLAAAALCVWGVLCLMFWQGSWQLLYHPTSRILHTPAQASVAFDEIGFATTEAGIPEMQGWWIPAGSGAKSTVLYFHGANGNMSDTVSALARLHAAGLGVFTFDYRGYGQSHFVRPSEARWRQDAESALRYLENTRHIPPGAIVVAGEGLGADLALEVAAMHPELEGAILDAPLPDPARRIFEDPRAELVPSRWLIEDRWGLDAAAFKLSIPSLWFCRATDCGMAGKAADPPVYAHVQSSKMLVRLTSPDRAQKDEEAALARWMGALPDRR
ncbi:MAG: alpha/beta fold hydrolase [Terracidiphilus sp.]